MDVPTLKIRIRLKAYDHKLLDQSAAEIVDTEEVFIGMDVESVFKKLLEQGELCVCDIVAALASLKKRGVEMIDASPRTGKENSKVAFIHPRSTNRVLFELVEPSDED